MLCPCVRFEPLDRLYDLLPVQVQDGPPPPDPLCQQQQPPSPCLWATCCLVVTASKSSSTDILLLLLLLLQLLTSSLLSSGVCGGVGRRRHNQLTLIADYPTFLHSSFSSSQTSCFLAPSLCAVNHLVVFVLQPDTTPAPAAPCPGASGTLRHQPAATAPRHRPAEPASRTEPHTHSIHCHRPGPPSA